MSGGVFVGEVTTRTSFHHEEGYDLRQKPSLSSLSCTRRAGRFWTGRGVRTAHRLEPPPESPQEQAFTTNQVMILTSNDWHPCLPVKLPKNAEIFGLPKLPKNLGNCPKKWAISQIFGIFPRFLGICPLFGPLSRFFSLGGRRRITNGASANKNWTCLMNFREGNGRNGGVSWPKND